MREAYGGGVQCSWKGEVGSLQAVWALAQKGTGLALFFVKKIIEILFALIMTILL